MSRVALQRAYVLHRRAYRETSFLVDILTPEYGRLTLVARGVRKSRSAAQGLLQSFVPLQVSWSGQGELMTLTSVEADGEALRLKGDCLFAGLYLNELMTYLLQKWDAQPELFRAYEQAITALQSDVLEEKTLRIFEKYLLEQLGYGVLSNMDIQLLSSLVPEQYYSFVPDQGFVLSEHGNLLQANVSLFLGKSLLAIAREDWDADDALHNAKRLHRMMLMPLLGSRPIFSRLLFTQPLGE